MNKVRLYRVLAFVLLAVLSIGMLAGCAPKLPEGYDEAELKTSAKKVIDLLNQRDSDGLTTLMTEEMKVGLTEDVQAQIFALLDESGSMQEITDMRVGSSEENGVTFAFVVAKVKYEKRDITYTIGFDLDYNLAGLYLK
jgi:hypothetical protein